MAFSNKMPTIASCILAVISAAALAAEPQDLAGSWTVTSTSPRGEQVETLTLNADGSGTYGDQAVTIALDGDNISFSVNRETPRGTVPISFTGTVDGADMSGEYTIDFSAMGGGGMGGGMGMGGGPSTWTASRSAD